jgi:hypothetical protein
VLEREGEVQDVDVARRLCACRGGERGERGAAADETAAGDRGLPEEVRACISFNGIERFCDRAVLIELFEWNDGHRRFSLSLKRSDG